MIFHISIESFNDLHKNNPELLKNADKVVVYDSKSTQTESIDTVYNYNKRTDKLEFWQEIRHNKR